MTASRFGGRWTPDKLPFLAAAILLATPAIGAHEHEHGSDAAPTAAELGKVSFETSCAPSVASDINRGVGLLHSFWHSESRNAFDKAASDDPECAMAYWGQAMASFHMYLSTATDADLAAVRVALTKADAAPKKSPREAAYIRAVHLLLEGYKPSEHYVYSGRFAEAMRDVAKKYPRDRDAKAFYALGLLASTPPGDVELTNTRKAIAILSPEFRRHPDHPGFVHYLIHACDHPQFAQQGLQAARRYASIAPAAPHALHMPSHIFARLGLWQDSIRSNLASKAASEVTTGPRIGAENRLHAMEFLQYAYLQSGQYDEARAIATEAGTVKLADTSYSDYYFTVEARFQALLAIESQDWAMAAKLEPVPDAHWYGVAQTLLARAIAAGHLRDSPAGKAVVESFKDLLEKSKVPPLPRGTPPSNLHDELHAWAALAQGDAEGAIGLLRPVADLQGKLGKGETELPAREMLAEILLLTDRPAEALVEYEQSLVSDPNRFAALLGAARAAEQSGRRALAEKYYRALIANCPNANGGALPVLAHAREVLSGRSQR